ncbi:MAG: CvpA family protein [candidate division Zixibacteria bacterium]|nr:CvpA family protein [candidate division Zixibacteria bacterium]
MNWVDFFIGVVLILAFVIGFKRGIFRELSTFIGLVIGTILAINYADWLAIQTEGMLNVPPSLRYVFCFVVCFAASIFVFKLLGHYFYIMVKLSPLKFSDKLGGGIFGVLKGAVVLSLIFLMFIFFPVFQSFNQSIDNSVMAPHVRQFVPKAFEMTSHFHPNSGKFADKINSGILGSKAQEYADDFESLLDDNEVLGFSTKDISVLNNVGKYFGDKVEIATKGD